MLLVKHPSFVFPCFTEHHKHTTKALDVAKPGSEIASEAEHDHSHGTELHSFIGVALVLGFVFMLLVDQIGGGHSHAPGMALKYYLQFIDIIFR